MLKIRVMGSTEEVAAAVEEIRNPFRVLESPILTPTATTKKYAVTF
jgi:hypothetical protein